MMPDVQLELVLDQQLEVVPTELELARLARSEFVVGILEKSQLAETTRYHRFRQARTATFVHMVRRQAIETKLENCRPQRSCGLTLQKTATFHSILSSFGFHHLSAKSIRWDFAVLFDTSSTDPSAFGGPDWKRETAKFHTILPSLDFHHLSSTPIRWGFAAPSDTPLSDPFAFGAPD